MALLGFDKAKILQTAEKYVLQNKIDAAIAEYSKILKKDPKDLMTLNTIGDLHIRANRNEEALKCFYELAEKYVEGGFVPRSIAVYKRIMKINAESDRAMLRLGELYSMQGLLRDARTHYLQAVELFMRRKEKERAREVFEKILLLDMENPKLQLQMAVLYADTGKTPEAIAMYLGAVERFLDRKEPSEASGALETLLKLDPGNLDGAILYGRMYVEQGDYSRAITALQAIPSLADCKGALNWLFHAYMKQGDVVRAREIATQLFDRHEDFAGLAQVCEQLLAGGDPGGALEIYQNAADRLVAQRAHSALIDGLKSILSSQPSHLGAMQLMWQVLRQAGDRGEAEEAGELLAHTHVINGELEKARDVYAELAQLAPENPEIAQLLRQVETRLSGGRPSEEEAPQPEPLMPSGLSFAQEQSKAEAEPLPAREQEIVSNCLTESELYVTYRQFPQAIAIVEKGLAEVPGNVTLQENLLRICERSGQYQKAAACAEALTEAYVMLGDGERATQYGELTLSFQKKALEMGSPAPEGVSLEAEPAAAGPSEASFLAATEPPPTEEPQVREVDLSMEWAALSGPETAPAATSAADSTAEEIEFYLQAGLTSEADKALQQLQELSPAHPTLSEFQARLAVLQGVAAPAAEGIAEPAAVEFGVSPSEEIGVAAESIPMETAAPELAVESAPSFIPEEVAAIPEPPPTPAELEEPVVEPLPEAKIPPAPAIPVEPLRSAAPHAEPELAWEDVLAPAGSPHLGSGFELSLEETKAAEHAPLGKAAPPPGIAPSAPPQDRFAALAGELSEVLGEPPAVAPAPPPPQAVAAAPPAQPSAGGTPGSLLDDMFAEFKEEMEEPAAAEDLETHYNMGVAFKEMALYDEAIGEFQKVHSIAEKAKDYSHLVLCCSLLATCFLEKGMPQLAVKWYQTALHSPGADPESSLALLYEIGAAQEIAGDREAALKSFLEVYGRNIDYRDVADRISALKQTQ